MSLKFSLITIAIRFILLQVCPSRRASFCMCCVIYTLFSCFERLFLCFARFGGISYCLNFDKLPDTASLGSRRKQPTFRDATTGFPAKWRLRNEHRNSMLMTRQIWVVFLIGWSKFPTRRYQSETLPKFGWWRDISMEFLRLPLRRHFAEKPVVASRSAVPHANKFLDFVTSLSNRTIFLR